MSRVVGIKTKQSDIVIVDKYTDSMDKTSKRY